MKMVDMGALYAIFDLNVSFSIPTFYIYVVHDDERTDYGIRTIVWALAGKIFIYFLYWQGKLEAVPAIVWVTAAKFPFLSSFLTNLMSLLFSAYTIPLRRPGSLKFDTFNLAVASVKFWQLNVEWQLEIDRSNWCSIMWSPPGSSAHTAHESPKINRTKFYQIWGVLSVSIIYYAPHKLSSWPCLYYRLPKSASAIFKNLTSI